MEQTIRRFSHIGLPNNFMAPLVLQAAEVARRLGATTSIIFWAVETVNNGRGRR